MDQLISLALRNASNDAQIISDDHGKILSWNRGAKEIFGYSISNIVGESITTLMPKSFQKVHIDALKDFRKTGRLLNAGSIYEMEGLTKSGKVFPVEISLNTFESEGVNYVCALVRDISKRKALERKNKQNAVLLEHVQQISQLGVWCWNVIENKVQWSDLLYEIYGISKDNFKSSFEGYLERVHPEDREIAQNNIKRALDTKSQINFEERIIRPNGEIRYLRSWAGVQTNKKGEVVEMIGACLDITGRKLAENQLKKAFAEVNMLKRQLEEENVYLREEIQLQNNYENMVYGSENFKDVLNQVEQVATTDATVLITGETGTGKELIARAIHNISNRNTKPLVKVNCAAIPKDLIESELFGHTKGAFTGATQDKMGKFELADGGTLFLDELGELSLDLQPKLLRALQEGEIEKVGGQSVRTVDVRVIAATNKNLKEEVQNGQFREDLYFRLNVFPINIPPLRERTSDIPFLLEHFVNKYATKHHKEINYISDDAMNFLKSYSWPGNVREFENTIERAIILSKDESLTFPDIKEDNHKKSKIGESLANLDLVMKEHILKILNDVDWVIDGDNGAAEKLGLKPSTLRDRMKKLGIKRPKS
ncbi:sigma 54-interacting transcriptional regulator [Paracrocinitomix mangrovi]|uniref:sigma 54-interacting transcriptional regulator n=1 Tax=Paracrocinitomix mangrovi TaxID=2862509 RepID=UPI001C8F084E|nr:sigma 54-interacting transcriptional regulator [Paracrocinitomix mangrovi]UKN02864.1 sigma 54-interacting transcriptional regulator [Paracrocinitomix mangrovi]